jgi:hypothetical protein
VYLSESPVLVDLYLRPAPWHIERWLHSSRTRCFSCTSNILYGVYHVVFDKKISESHMTERFRNLLERCIKDKDKPFPLEPFPHVNDTERIRRLFNRFDMICFFSLF